LPPVLRIIAVIASASVKSPSELVTPNCGHWHAPIEAFIVLAKRLRDIAQFGVLLL
jgi:hypothetical protein